MRNYYYYYNYYDHHTTTTTTTTTTLPHLMMTMMMVVVMVVVTPVMAGQNGELCVVETPLHTPYVRSHKMTPVTCPGCQDLTTHDPHLANTPTMTQDDLKLTPNGINQVHILDFNSSVVRSEEVVVVVVEEEGEGGYSGGVRKVVVVLVTPSPPHDLRFKVRSSSARVQNQNLTEYLFVVDEGTKIEITDLPHTTTTTTTTTTTAAATAAAAATTAATTATATATTATTAGLMANIRQRFGFVSFYARVIEATEVTLRIPEDTSDRGGSACGGDGGGGVVEASPVVECGVVEEVEVDGCYHKDMLGRDARDIHIIEVTNSSQQVIVKLVGGGGGGVARNVTLVLRSGHHTSWQLVTSQLQGMVTLLVGGGDSVENTSVPGRGGVAVEVRRVELPASFDQLLLSVLTSLGPPVSYTRSKDVTYVTLFVTQEEEEEEEEEKDNHFGLSSHLTNFDTSTVYRSHPSTVIQEGLSVVCGTSSLTLALPYPTAARVGGVAMALQDRACVGSRNGTHIVLYAMYTECKFKRSYARNGKVVYTNLLSLELGPVVVSDDEDEVEGMEGSGYGHHFPPPIPSLLITCSPPPSPPHLPPHPPPPPPPPQRPPLPQLPHLSLPHTPNKDGVDFNWKPKSGGGMRGVSYTLTLYSDHTHTHPLLSTPARHTPAPTPVPPHSWLHVQAALATVLPWSDTTTSTTTTTTTTTNLNVVLEECWISNTTTTTTSTTTTGPVLLRKSCRVHESVSVDAMYTHTHAPSFSFQVLPEYSSLTQFYLHCRLGVCSSDTLPRPAVIKCSEPTLYCSKPALLKVFDGQPASSSLQTLTLGPLNAPATTKSALFGGVSHTTSSSQGLKHQTETNGINKHRVEDDDSPSQANTNEGQTEEKTEIVVLRGLSTEIVVGIALASFVIGVCLTATLWVIHMKTDPRRQKRSSDGSSAPRNSGYDLSGHSGSSTPSSQAPMTA